MRDNPELGEEMSESEAASPAAPAPKSDAVSAPAPADAVIAPVLPQGVPVEQLSPIVLAYIGDAVFEVYVRQRLIAGPVRKPHELHRAATRHVSAGAQARLLSRWMPLLTETEREMVRRGRNTKSGQPPKNADPGDYRHATALECLVGYLFYRGERARLEELIGLAFASEENPDAADPDASAALRPDPGAKREAASHSTPEGDQL